MKYMLTMWAAESESGAGEHETERTAVAEFDEQLIRAGVLLVGERLAMEETTVVGSGTHNDRDHGNATDDTIEAPPTALWILQVASREEAVEWARRCPVSSGRIRVQRVLEKDEPRPAGAPDPTREALWRSTTA